jgi:hypothetical protein
MSDTEFEPEENEDEVEISRRKFLQWTKYVPPAVISLLASTSAAEAATCNPNLCNPDDSNTCGPDDSCTPDF